MRTLLITVAALVLGIVPSEAAERRVSVKQAEAAMKAATEYMMDKVSYRGGFASSYLADLSRQWGEMESKRSMVWTQYPATPAMGNILLDAYHATGDEYYYQAAQKVASALIAGQLECGGWNYVFDMEGEESLKDWYNTVGAAGWRLEEYQHYYGNATFDDSCSTDCGEYLLRFYLEKKDPLVLKALDRFIDFVLESQYPCGGWPQRYPLMYDHPFRGKADYTSFITLNDSVIPECIEFLLKCCSALGRPELKEPVYRAIYLTLVLQQGKPYSGWSDQYTVPDLKPAHARSYEPVGVNTGTTAKMISLMYRFYGLTGDSRFLAGIPSAIDFLESQALPEPEVRKSGKMLAPGSVMMPRFVDPVTGEPHYVHREGTNVYNGQYFYDTDISNTIGHYSSTYTADITALRKQYESVLATPVADLVKDSPLLESGVPAFERFFFKPSAIPGDSESLVREYVDQLRKEGFWFTVLRNTSNPYKKCADAAPSHETGYVSTNVGDEYDTSPYRSPVPQKGIYVPDYINRMSLIIRYITEYEKTER